MAKDSCETGNHSCRNESGSGFTSWLLGLFLGALGGATIAVLYAPKSGSQMRDELKESAKELPERLTEFVDDSLDLYATAVNYLQLAIEEQGLRIKKTVAASKLAAAKKREELELGNSSVLPFQHR
jgi:gas vesicle protein